jgi:hypothetical protein
LSDRYASQRRAIVFRQRQHFGERQASCFQAPVAPFPDQFRCLGVTLVLWRLGGQQLFL